jgi:DNA-binding MarR family transcriptional regulator
MEEITLTPKERNTLYGLVRFPDLNDRALAEVLDEKMSTVTSIRRRLHDRGYFTKVRIPRFERLGCEILCICHGSFKPVMPEGNEILAKMDEGIPATYFGISNPYHFVMLGAARNFTDARGTYDEYYRNERFLKAIDERNLVFSFLPYPLTNILNFFEFAPLLRSLFGITDKDNAPTDAGMNAKARRKNSPPEPCDGLDELSVTERKVLLGLVRFPELPDKALSDKIKVSRQVVSKMRRKLETEGYVRTAIIPDLSKLGLGMIIFTHYTLNPKTAGSFNEKSLIGTKEGLSSFFLCSGQYEFFTLSAFRSYQDFERVSERYHKIYSENKALLGSPVILPFSIEDLTFFRNHTYANILKNVLGL